MERWAIEGGLSETRICVEVEELPARPRFVARAASGGCGVVDVRDEGASPAEAVAALSWRLNRAPCTVLSPAELAAEGGARGVALDGLPLEAVRALRDACNRALGEG